MNAFKAWRYRLHNQKLIGIDRKGNEYVEDFSRATAARLVYYKGEIGRTAVPHPWRAWLDRQRPDPPTDKELQEDELRALQMQRKVQEFDKKEARLRAEEAAARISEEQKKQQELSGMSRHQMKDAMKQGKVPQPTPTKHDDDIEFEIWKPK
ncbi:hypothetical protein PROFUN_03253 [Planoprotostelium fungivorum]|uniref:Uncharacterized protein n=1 Tax=Planoprotostelium fungivorum TaxID=1890364 RepID=A0A2P6NWL0_9EUKA|nr:hypothetical protein PROFUN_03253 [Planoprotostelium fungivorum]